MKNHMLLDAWEHAYYLQYQNRRADYVENIWRIVSWRDVEGRFESCLEVPLSADEEHECPSDWEKRPVLW